MPLQVYLKYTPFPCGGGHAENKTIWQVEDSVLMFSEMGSRCIFKLLFCSTLIPRFKSYGFNLPRPCQLKWIPSLFCSSMVKTTELP